MRYKIKSTGLTIFLIGFSFLAFPQTLQKDNLKGQVKSVVQYNYSVFEKSETVQKVLNEKYIYKYDKNGITTTKQEYIINKAKQLTLNTTAQYVLNNNVIRFQVYDSNNRLFKNGGKVEFQLNKNQDIVEENQFASDGKIFYKEIFRYNENNHLIVWISYSPIGFAHSRTVNIYDNDEKLIETNNYDGYNPLPQGKIKYKYNSEGNLIEKQNLWNNGHVESIITYTYDINNNIIEENTFYPDANEPYKKDYIKNESYDTNGNWLKQTNTWKGRLANIIERKIEYY